MTTLPTKPGFYWWRETPADEFRMVQVIDFSEGQLKHLCAYDVQHKAWSGYSFDVWQHHRPVGEWQPVATPEDLAELNDRCTSHLVSMMNLAGRQAREIAGWKREHRAAHREALTLARSLYREIQQDSPHWKPLPDVAGIISQIDNMIGAVSV